MKSLFENLFLVTRFVFLENRFVGFLAKQKNFNQFLWIFYSSVIVNVLMPVLSFFTSYRYFEDVFEVCWVDPEDINYVSAIDEDEFVYNLRYGRFIGGSWDQQGKDIEDLELFQELRKYLDNSSWEDTNLYELFMEREKKWCSSKEERKKAVDRLIEVIQQEGYKTQRELLQENPKDVLKKCNDTLFPQLNEIQVSVGRNGELFWETNGQHRLILAKLLELDKIPVLVRARHRSLL